MSEYTVLWLLWLAQFLAIEAQALVSRRPGATLTAHVAAWFSTGFKHRWWRLRRASLLAFLAWLLVHLFTGGEAL